MNAKPLKSSRWDFPALSREYLGRPLVYLDGPGGTQVPSIVIEEVSNYYRRNNANTHGYFPTTRETDQVIEKARQSMAEFLGAAHADTISFGQNMTTLTFSLSKALARKLPKGSEIVITQLDHEANRGPWLRLAEYGFIVKEVKLRPDGTLDYEDFQRKIGPRTGLVAVGYASNALGTINDLTKIREWTNQHGALLWIDAVHFAPHFCIDVQTLDCDFLLCSAYKFYGPHVGILYTRPGLLEQLDPDRLITQEQKAPYLMETGTLNHAALAGVTSAVQYLASLGHGSNLRARLVSAMETISQHEYRLCKKLYQGLASMAGISIVGPELKLGEHAPTLSFTVEGRTAAQVCQFLANKGICAWDGHFYAQRAIEALGLLEQGGVTRMGISLYTSEDDIDYTLGCMKELVRKQQLTAGT